MVITWTAYCNKDVRLKNTRNRGQTTNTI